MRILEHCISSASPEVKVQIDALREAFSQDTTRPFELKPTLGLRSPSLETHSTPPGAQQSQPGGSIPGTASWAHLQDADSSKTISPASEYAPPFEPTPSQSTIPFNTSSFPAPPQVAYAPTSVHQVTSAPQQGYALEPVISNEQHTPVWDPSGIFQQWNTAFGPQAQAPPQQAPIVNPNGHLASATIMPPPQHAQPSQQPIYAAPQMPPSAGSAVAEALPTMPTVTPVMWQDAFTNAYASGHGHKRYREESLDQNPYDQYAKRRG